MSFQVKLHHRSVESLKALCGGQTPARIANRARVLLLLNEGFDVDEVADRSGVSTATVKRIRKRYLEEGWRIAVAEKPRPGRPKKFTTKEEKEIIALACSKAPDGCARWTVRLLADHTGVSYGTVQRVLSEDGLKPWREKNVVRPRNRR